MRLAQSLPKHLCKYIRIRYCWQCPWWLMQPFVLPIREIDEHPGIIRTYMYTTSWYSACVFTANFKLLSRTHIIFTISTTVALTVIIFTIIIIIIMIIILFIACTFVILWNALHHLHHLEYTADLQLPGLTFHGAMHDRLRMNPAHLESIQMGSSSAWNQITSRESVVLLIMMPYNSLRLVPYSHVSNMKQKKTVEFINMANCSNLGSPPKKTR